MSLYRNRHEKGTLLKNVLGEIRAFWRSFEWIVWSLLAASLLSVGCQRFNRWAADESARDEKLAPTQSWTVTSVSYRHGADDVRWAEVNLYAHDTKGRYVPIKGIVANPTAPDYPTITGLHLGQKVKLLYSPTVLVGHAADNKHLLVLPPGSK